MSSPHQPQPPYDGRPGQTAPAGPQPMPAPVQPPVDPGRSRPSVGVIALLGLVGLLVVGLLVGGFGWSQGWFGGRTAEASLKPVSGQTLPDTFGDRNTATGPAKQTASQTSRQYKDPSGRIFSVILQSSAVSLEERAQNAKPEWTRIYGGVVYCFDVKDVPTSCEMQLAGGTLYLGVGNPGWSAERMESTLRAMHATLKP